MTRNDTIKILSIVMATFPSHYMKFDQIMTDRLIESWTDVFGDYEYKDVYAGLNIFLKTDLSGFPPTPAMIIDKIAKHTEHSPEYEMTGMEAWALVSKAIKNSNYNSEEEYRLLPPLVQKAVGSPSTLREWAAMDSNTVHSVEQSNFLRMYDAIAKRARDDKKLPQAYRMQIETRPVMQIEVADPEPRCEHPEWVDDRLKELRDELKGGKNEN